MASTDDYSVITSYRISSTQDQWLRDKSAELVSRGLLRGSGRSKNLSGMGGMSELLRRVIDMAIRNESRLVKELEREQRQQRRRAK